MREKKGAKTFLEEKRGENFFGRKKGGKYLFQRKKGGEYCKAKSYLLFSFIFSGQEIIILEIDNCQALAYNTHKNHIN